MIIDVTHMSGAGNLFTVLNNEKYNFDISQLQLLSPILCGINEFNSFYSEGLIAVSESDDKTDFKSEFINPDGSYGAMCGNGGRCAVQYALKLGLIEDIDKKINFSMSGNLYQSVLNPNGDITIFFNPPKKVIHNSKMNYNDEDYNFGFVDIGSQHLVIDYKSLKNFEKIGFRDFDLVSFSRPFRFHKSIEPLGANVNVFFFEKECIELRTYERGVEEETGACGTGAISTAIIASLNYDMKFPVKLIPPSKEPLYVDIIKSDEGKIREILLTGNARNINSSKINIPDDLFNKGN